LKMYSISNRIGLFVVSFNYLFNMINEHDYLKRKNGKFKI
jgi:hypothetical protein